MHSQHALSNVFPSMPVHVFERFRDGVAPAPEAVIRAMLQSKWFKGLKKSQRAMYVVTWFHWLKHGSNQYKHIVRTDTPRYAAELAQAGIERAARA
jgi:hypothetical protein